MKVPVHEGDEQVTCPPERPDPAPPAGLPAQDLPSPAAPALAAAGSPLLAPSSLRSSHSWPSSCHGEGDRLPASGRPWACRGRHGRPRGGGSQPLQGRRVPGSRLPSIPERRLPRIPVRQLPRVSCCVRARARLGRGGGLHPLGPRPLSLHGVRLPVAAVRAVGLAYLQRGGVSPRVQRPASRASPC
jgi:hypothetical protein